MAMPDPITGAAVVDGPPPTVAAGQNGQPAVQPGSANPLLSPSTYDPNNPTPYQPLQGAQVTPFSPQLIEDEPVQNLGAAGHAGAIAYIGDKLLRGVMQGRAQNQMKQAIDLQKDQSARSALYDQAAQRLIQMKQGGVDPNSPDFQAAMDQKNAAWNSLTDLWDQHAQKMVTDPKTGKPVAAKGNLLQRMFNTHDPMQVAPAWVEAMKANGPPVDHVLSQMDTPAYQAKMQQRAQTMGTQAGTAATTAQAGQIAAQGGVTNAQTSAAAASANQELQQLMTQQEPLTLEQQTRKQQLIDARYMSPGSGLSAAAQTKAQTWLPMSAGGSQPVPDGKGGYFVYQRNALSGATRTVPLQGYVPSVADQRGIVRVDQNQQTGAWEQWMVDRNGDEIKDSRRPAQFAGRTTTTSSTTSDNTGNVQHTGRTVTVAPPSIGGQQPTGGGGPASGEGAGIARSAATVAPAAAAGAVPATGAAAAATSSPSLKLGYPGALPLNAPGAPTPALDPTNIDWKPNSNDPAQVWAKRVYDGGNVKLSDVPSQPKYLKTAVQNFMEAHNMDIGDPDTMADRNMIHTMRDAYPNIQKAIDLLAPFKDQDGAMDALKQRINAHVYQAGVNPQSLGIGMSSNPNFKNIENTVNQLVALDALSATAPWTKLGRNKMVYQDIQDHVPKFKTDSPGQMYDKLQGLKQIFDTNVQSYYDRHHQQNPMQPAAATGGGGSVAQPAAATAQPAQVAPPPPTPQTHAWSKSGWLAAHPGGDVNAAVAQAQAAKFNVVP